MKFIQFLFGVFFLTAADATSCAFAQSVQAGIGPPVGYASAYYYIAKPGELTMQVNLWGMVRNPGRYEVASTVDLVELLSLAGGPQEYADMSEVRITRITKSEKGVVKREHVVDLEHLDSVPPEELVLNPGDTIVIDPTSWPAVRDAFSVVTTLAVIAAAVASLISVSR
jgi:hypothetical protein